MRKRDVNELLVFGLLVVYLQQRRTARKVDALLALATASPLEYDSIKKRVIDHVLDLPFTALGI